MVNSYCDQFGTVHRKHVIHDLNYHLVTCYGDTNESLAASKREAEYQDAKDKIKHNKRMGDLERRQKFGWGVAVEAVLKALGWLALGLIVGTVLSMLLNSTKPESAPEPSSFPTMQEGYALCQERGLEFTVPPRRAVGVC